MSTTNKIGIWMDHQNAHLTTFSTEPMITNHLVSTFTHGAKEKSLEKSEHLMHNKEQQSNTAWYKKLGEEIKKYDGVLLFGPTDAKLELFNVLSADRHFEKIKIDVVQADKMTVKEEQAFVREHFSGR
ncbi:MAG TPA: hypothetical protein VKI61_04330 [Chitinophagaceae bacterium]|jgi:hypothetical protein|nr:hypothetical protein [Chitinophagaceae bacterium]